MSSIKTVGWVKVIIYFHPICEVGFLEIFLIRRFTLHAVFTSFNQ